MSTDPERFAAQRLELFRRSSEPHVFAVDDDFLTPRYVVAYCKCGAVLRSYAGGDDLRRKIEVHLFTVGVRHSMPS